MSRLAAVAVMVVSALSVAQGKVSSAGALSAPRVGHTATLLADGRVLVVGGRSSDLVSVLSSCELFSPKTKAWSTTGALGTARSAHTATRLNDGRVLVVGGTAPDSAAGSSRFLALAAAELFDPKHGSWSATAPMKNARNGHTATLLKDGRVLVVGGAREQRQLLTSVEVFDPATGTWSDGAPVSVPRWQHDALRLEDGTVLIVGGRSNRATQGAGPGISIADGERFDPATSTWTATPPLNEPVQRFATVWSGSGKEVLVVGGQTTTGMTNYVERWTPGAPAWTVSGGNLSMALASHAAAALPNGDVVVMGGEAPTAVDTRHVVKWDVAAKKWCLAGELLSSRKSHTATVLADGSVLVVGGTSSGVPEKSAELWQAAKTKCEPVESSSSDE